MRDGAVFVTGGGGFVGSAVVTRLIAENVKVRVLTGSPEDILREPPAHIPSTRSDINDFDVLAELAKGCDAIVHLAGPASVASSFDAATRYVRAHVDGTATILEVCRKLGIQRLVYLSSAEIYGRSKAQPVSETIQPDPRSPYAAAKLGAEYLIRAFVNGYGMSARVLRPFSIYGPGQPQYALLPTIMRQAREGDAVVLADTKPIRDYCFVDDVAEAIALACETDVPGLTTLNIGTGVGTSVLELAQAVLNTLGRDIPIISSEQHSKRPADAEIYELIADNRLARRLLNWVPRTTLAAGLESLASACCG